jgi:alkaline phosphatase
MKKFLNLSAIVLIIITLTAAGSDKKKPKNLILFIGDGMGVTHVYAAMTASGFTMVFPAFPVTGYSITNSHNRYITDSAAGATAMSTGEKTSNGMIATRPDGTELVTIMEMAKLNGMSAGVVSTSEITHATPAAFIAHEGLRSDYFEIARDFLKGTADVFIGGGRAHFAYRPDSADLTVDLKEMGYDVVNNIDDLRKSSSSKLAGLMAEKALPSITNGRDPDFLSIATSKAIEVLSRNSNGFILMVEGSEIDWEGHDNDTDGIVKETLDMDRAVKVAYEFARRSKNTLIVVTADHETGGFSITDGSIEDKTVSGSFTTKGHTAVMVPVFAFGPGASYFSGVQQNTELFDDFVKLLSLKKNDK